MYRTYASSDPDWSDGLSVAQAFIDGPLADHLRTWPRHGRLGVPETLDARALCAELPAALAARGRFGLMLRCTAPVLLVLPLHDASPPRLLCYGRWPGIDAWEAEVEARMPAGLTLLSTCWNHRVPELPQPVRWTERLAAWLQAPPRGSVGLP